MTVATRGLEKPEPSLAVCAAPEVAVIADALAGLMMKLGLVPLTLPLVAIRLVVWASTAVMEGALEPVATPLAKVTCDPLLQDPLAG